MQADQKHINTCQIKLSDTNWQLSTYNNFAAKSSGY